MNERIKQLDLLDESIDMKKVPILACTKTLVSFLLNVTQSLFYKKVISNHYYEDVTEGLNYANNFFQKGIKNSEELEKYRSKYWALHDRLEEGSFNQNLTRAIICCFYDKPEETETSDDKIELYFLLMWKIDDTYCKQFREFCEVDLKAYSHEAKDGD